MILGNKLDISKLRTYYLFKDRKLEKSIYKKLNLNSNLIHTKLIEDISNGVKLKINLIILYRIKEFKTKITILK